MQLAGVVACGRMEEDGATGGILTAPQKLTLKGDISTSISAKK